jgi:hypothetical protein
VLIASSSSALASSSVASSSTPVMEWRSSSVIAVAAHGSQFGLLVAVVPIDFNGLPCRGPLW